jgi:hypothetical protein
MHFFGRATLERFLFKASNDWLIDTRDTPVLTLSRATLPRSPTVIVLPGRSTFPQAFRAAWRQLQPPPES